jgi:hypothetical protein
MAYKTPFFGLPRKKGCQGHLVNGEKIINSRYLIRYLMLYLTRDLAMKPSKGWWWRAE